MARMPVPLQGSSSQAGLSLAQCPGHHCFLSSGAWRAGEDSEQKHRAQSNSTLGIAKLKRFWFLVVSRSQLVSYKANTVKSEWH